MPVNFSASGSTVRSFSVCGSATRTADNGWYRLAQFAATELNAASVTTDHNVSPDMVTLLFMRTVMHKQQSH